MYLWSFVGGIPRAFQHVSQDLKALDWESVLGSENDPRSDEGKVRRALERRCAKFTVTLSYCKMS